MRSGTPLAGLALLGMTIALVSAAGASPEPRVVWEWRAADGMKAWQPNEQIANVKETAEEITFDTTGGDPIMVYRQPLSVPASAWQAFEVTLKADSSGQAELFWTETTTGPYGGFSGEKATRFSVVGDGAWHTYRVFPFWQAVGRIIKLRFDPYGRARFSLASMRILEWTVPRATTATLRMPADAGRLVPLHGVSARPVRDGLQLTQHGTDGFALAPLPSVVAEERPCVALRLTSLAERRAALVFATDRSYGLQELSLSLTPDGRPHTYNLDGLQHPGWKGHIVAVGIRPASGVVLHSLDVADRPRGPAELRIQAFDATDALPRAARAVGLTARVWNAGGEAATGCKLVFELPRGARFVGKEAAAARTREVPLPRLVYGQEYEASCRVVFPTAGLHRVVLRVETQGRLVARSACAVRVTPAPVVRRTGYPPPPEPVRGKIDVGVYYFPGWRTAGQWSPITRFPERRPVLGWYREGDPSVADWHIKWAVEHGVTFFAYDWYWSAGARSLEHALHEGLFRARYRHSLRFCLLWANHNPPRTSSHDDFMAVVRYWLDHYFHLPEYYTIDGKPVVIIFTPYRFRADMGSEAVRRAFEDMREECRKDGLPGLYLVACVGGDIGEARVAAQEGYDAISAYNWPALGLRANERVAPFKDLLKPHREHWERLAEAGPLPLMTPVSGGWDSRPWHGDTALVRSGRTPEIFRQHLLDARSFIETHPGTVLPIALVEAWNEWGEGSYIEPHRQYGFGYLDAIREVFTDAPKAHTDLTPADVGHAPPEVNVAANTRGQWDLTQDAQGWDSGMNLANFRIEEGGLKAVTTGDDPAFFGPPIQVHADACRTLRLRMRLTAPAGSPDQDTAQVFWTTRSAPTSEEASVRFPVRLDGEWHEYRVTLSSNVRWRGIITSLRLDPCNRADVEVAISRIALE